MRIMLNCHSVSPVRHGCGRRESGLVANAKLSFLDQAQQDFQIAQRSLLHLNNQSFVATLTRADVDLRRSWLWHELFQTLGEFAWYSMIKQQPSESWSILGMRMIVIMLGAEGRQLPILCLEPSLIESQVFRIDGFGNGSLLNVIKSRPYFA